MSALRGLLEPRSIALIGASADPTRFGGRPLQALRRWEYPGDILLVNPRHDEIGGVPCVPRVEDLPTGLDLGVILLHADAAVAAVDICAAKGFSAVAVFSGGFAESGGEGSARQDRLVAAARRGGMRLLGPNCPGFVNVRHNVACSASAFAQRDEMFSGRTAFVVQSGAVAGILADRAFDRGIGVNAVVCTGNEADVCVPDLIDWFVDDPDTHAVGLFLESLGTGTRLAETLRRARDGGLRVAALKAGRSEESRRVIASHTGRLVGADEAFDAMCHRYGIIRTGGYDELLEATHLLAVAPDVGCRLAVVGSSGGMHALLVDVGVRHGIVFPELSRETMRRIAEVTPDFGSMVNPVDISSLVLIDPERLGTAVRVLGADPIIDTVVVVVGDHPEELSERIATAVVAAAAATSVPVVVQWSAGPLSLPGIRMASRNDVAVFMEPGNCARLLAAAVNARVDQDKDTESVGEPFVVPAPGATESEVKDQLSRAGFPIPRWRVVADPADAASAVEELGSRAVVKANCVGPVHKSDHGAVVLDVSAPDAPLRAQQVLASAREAFGPETVRGILVEQQVVPVAEFIVSLIWDEHAGSLITVGAGGELVELVADAVTRVAPVGEDEALEMVRMLRTSEMLDGFAGGPRGDAAALANVVARLSAATLPEDGSTRVIELNPVAVLTGGAVILDAVVEGVIR